MPHNYSTIMLASPSDATWEEYVQTGRLAVCLGSIGVERTSEISLRERRIRNHPNAELLQHGHHLPFFLAIDGVVQILHRDELGETVLPRVRLHLVD